LKRSSDHLYKFINTGHQINVMEVVSDWIIDHLLYVKDLLWGFIEPVLTMIYWSVVRILLIIVFNVIFFVGVYLLITY